MGEKIMAYIRTKDNKVYNLDHLVETTIGQKPYRTADSFLIYKSEIEKQVKTIKELCDVFVIHFRNVESILIYDYKTAEEYARGIEGLSRATDVYGAIWTDKGLTYVAKFTNKGALKLL